MSAEHLPTPHAPGTSTTRSWGFWTRKDSSPVTASLSNQAEEFGRPDAGETFSPGSVALKKILRKPTVILSLGFLVLIILLACFAPLITQISGCGPFEYDESVVDPPVGGLRSGPVGGVGTAVWMVVDA